MLDDEDECEATPTGETVNPVGCSDSQVDPVLNGEDWPPYGLTFTTSGNIGRPGGGNWTYTAIDHRDLFHIWWVPCDDPSYSCGLSMDGNVFAANEEWVFDAANSNLPGGVLVFTNTTNIVLFDNSTPALTGRLTLTITGAGQPLPFLDVASIGLVPREGSFAAEIPGAAYLVNMIIDVQDTPGGAWTPYLDYFDAAQTMDGGPQANVSFGGTFYEE